MNDSRRQYLLDKLTLSMVLALYAMVLRLHLSAVCVDIKWSNFHRRGSFSAIIRLYFSCHYTIEIGRSNLRVGRVELKPSLLKLWSAVEVHYHHYSFKLVSLL